MPLSLRIPPQKEEMIKMASKKAGKTKSAFIVEAIDEKLGLVKNREAENIFGCALSGRCLKYYASIGSNSIYPPKAASEISTADPLLLTMEFILPRVVGRMLWIKNSAVLS